MLSRWLPAVSRFSVVVRRRFNDASNPPADDRHLNKALWGDQPHPALAVPMFGTVPKREYAMRVAEAFLLWLEREGCRDAFITSERLAEAAEHFFAPELGIKLPPMRSLLGELKRLPGVRARPNYRIYDADRKFVSKATVYSFSPRATVDCDAALYGKLRRRGWIKAAALRRHGHQVPDG